MSWGTTALIFVFGAFAAVFLGWRVASVRRSLPCPFWLAALVEMDNPFFPSNGAKAIVAGLGLAPGMRVLDAGCGPGRLTIPLAIAVGPKGNVLALDLQPSMLTRARTRAARAMLANVDFRVIQLGADTLPKSQFDRATIAAVLGEVPDRLATMRELFGSLKPSGVLAVSEVIADPHFQRRSRVLALARDAGFREKSRIGHALGYTLYLERPA